MYDCLQLSNCFLPYPVMCMPTESYNRHFEQYIVQYAAFKQHSRFALWVTVITGFERSSCVIICQKEMDWEMFDRLSGKFEGDCQCNNKKCPGSPHQKKCWPTFMGQKEIIYRGKTSTKSKEKRHIFCVSLHWSRLLFSWTKAKSNVPSLKLRLSSSLMSSQHWTSPWDVAGWYSRKKSLSNSEVSQGATHISSGVNTQQRAVTVELYKDLECTLLMRALSLTVEASLYDSPCCGFRCICVVTWH